MDVMDGKALRIFMAVVRYRSIRSAADHLGLAPSVVSRQIADTERQLGLSLFDRSSRGVGLTDAGALVFEHCKRVLEDGLLLDEQLAQLKGLQQARLRIWCGEGFLADLIENGLGAFAATHPTLRYALHLAGTEGVMDATINGDCDIGIAYNPVIEPRLRTLAIARQPLCVIFAPGHGLEAVATPSLADCLGEACALLGQGHGVTQLVGRVAADHGLALAPLVETASIDALRRFVIAGLGVTFLPRFAIATELARGTLRATELADPPLAAASAHLLVKARRRLPLSVDRLAAHLAGSMVAFRAD